MVFPKASLVIQMLNSLTLFGKLSGVFFISCDLKMATVMHPQTDSHTEVVNRSLSDMLCCLTTQAKDWELVISQAEFAYNNFVNHSMSLSPFHICICYDASTPLDLAPLPPMFPTNTHAQEFAKDIQSVHVDVKKMLEKVYATVKARTDLHRRSQLFKVGDMVLHMLYVAFSISILVSFEKTTK